MPIRENHLPLPGVKVKIQNPNCLSAGVVLISCHRFPDRLSESGITLPVAKAFLRKHNHPMARGQQDDFSSAEGISQISADFFAFATDREDVKWSLARLPALSTGERTAVEYELGALKIIAVGWSITYLMGERPFKESLQTAYWQSVQSLAGDLSRGAGMLIGRPIDYFEVLKQRFETYLEAMRECPCQREPSQVVGPAFAHNCGLPEDLQVAMAGARLFKNSLLRVHEYLKVIGLC